MAHFGVSEAPQAFVHIVGGLPYDVYDEFQSWARGLGERGAACAVKLADRRSSATLDSRAADHTVSLLLSRREQPLQ